MSNQQSKLLQVHGDSIRVGIRLAWHMFSGVLPPDDKVLQVIMTKPAHVVVNEFSLDILSTVKRERLEHRRVTAMRAMEIMLHHTGEVDHLTEAMLAKIAAKAWRLANFMDEQETVTLLVDTLADPNETKKSE